ncbi:MAG: hypothetical protein ACOCY6_04970 [Halodesulfurarchaeum sp.]
MDWDRPYFFGVGVLLVVAGALAVFMGVVGNRLVVGPAEFGGPFAVWRGPVVAAAGAFMLRATVDGISSREDQALIFMGGLMIWIVGGTELFAILLEAIPGGSGAWIATPSGFVAAISPPYPLAVVAVVLTLPAVRYTEKGIATVLKRIFGRNG